MERLENYHIIIVKALGATNTLPARVKIVSERFEQYVIIPFSHDPGAFSPALSTAVQWLTKKGFALVGQGEGKDHYYVIADTFKPLKAE